jgi:hypothetical protein
MDNGQEHARLTMHGPANYRIRVRGRLDAEWSERLEGMNVTHSDTRDGDFVTVLDGRLADQAALSGYSIRSTSCTCLCYRWIVWTV